MAQSRIVEYRGVIVVGKVGVGKSTVANMIVQNDDRFKVSSEVHTQQCSHCEVEIFEGESLYRMRVMDSVGLSNTGLITNDEAITALKNYLQNYFKDGINLIIFVLQEGHFTPEDKKTFEFIRSKFGEDTSVMSALVITNCDMMDEDARRALITEFRSNEVTKPIAEFMEAGIYTVGFPSKEGASRFPDQVKSNFEESIAKDKEKLWDLVKQSCKANLSKKLYKKSFFLGLF